MFFFFILLCNFFTRIIILYIHINYLFINNYFQVIAGLHSVLTWDRATVQQRKIGHMYPHPSKNLIHNYPQGDLGVCGESRSPAHEHF